MKWTKEETEEIGWQPGWFLMEVQDSNLSNDWIKAESNIEPGNIQNQNVYTLG